MGARETALRVLAACRNNNAWADAALKAQLNRDGLVGADAALCSRMVYGVMQNQLLLDFYLAAYCSQKPDHLQQPLTEILRLGAYQILFLDRVQLTPLWSWRSCPGADRQQDLSTPCCVRYRRIRKICRKSRSGMRSNIFRFAIAIQNGW